MMPYPEDKYNEGQKSIIAHGVNYYLLIAISEQGLKKKKTDIVHLVRIREKSVSHIFYKLALP
jgi:RNA:NAD 2'-phosphotransferase (TPT1/KptA family)